MGMNPPGGPIAPAYEGTEFTFNGKNFVCIGLGPKNMKILEPETKKRYTLSRQAPITVTGQMKASEFYLWLAQFETTPELNPGDPVRITLDKKGLKGARGWIYSVNAKTYGIVVENQGAFTISFGGVEKWSE
jgi:hypothetical protein